MLFKDCCYSPNLLASLLRDDKEFSGKPKTANSAKRIRKPADPISLLAVWVVVVVATLVTGLVTVVVGVVPVVVVK
jgi:hypothetical protein